MKLPAEALKKLFQASLKRGTVYKTLYHSPDTGISKEKYFVLVSGDPKQADPVFFFITTSKTDFYDKHPHIQKDFVVVEKGEAACFSLRTLINCRRIETFSRAILEDRFVHGACEVAGEVPGAILWEIDEAVRKSDLLSDAERIAILGEPK